MSRTELIPVKAVTPKIVAEKDVVVYVPLASRTAHGIVKISDGLLINHAGELSLDRSEITVLKIAKNGVDITPDENKRVNLVLNKTDVGLDKVDNTADVDKPVSTQTRKALNDINNSVTSVDEKLSNYMANTNNPHKVTKEQVGLGNVDNTSDINKPVSTAVRAAINTVDTKITNHMKDYNNPHKVTKSQVGLDRADNTADLDKPVSNATQLALNAIKISVNNDLLTIQNTVKDLSSLIKQQDRALSFASYEAVIEEFNWAATNKYQVGQTVFVNTRNVPDLWVYSVETTHVDYGYIGDADVVEQLEENGTVQFGYYKLAPLETHNVELNNVVTVNDPQKITGLKVFKSQLGISRSGSNAVDYITYNVNNVITFSDSDGLVYFSINKPDKTLHFYNEPIALEKYVDDNFVSYTKEQTFNASQKTLLKNNIGLDVVENDIANIRIKTDELSLNTSTNNVLLCSDSVVFNLRAVGIGRDTLVRTDSVGIGHSVNTSKESVAVGSFSTTSGSNGIAIGYNASSKAVGAIQLLTGENLTQNTLQIGDDNIYNHSSHTLTVKNIELNGKDLGTTLTEISANSIKIATDSMIEIGEDETTAVNPKQLKTAINNSLGSVENWLMEINNGSGI